LFLNEIFNFREKGKKIRKKVRRPKNLLIFGIFMWDLCVNFIQNLPKLGLFVQNLLIQNLIKSESYVVSGG